MMSPVFAVAGAVLLMVSPEPDPITCVVTDVDACETGSVLCMSAALVINPEGGALVTVPVMVKMVDAPAGSVGVVKVTMGPDPMSKNGWPT